jgi:single-stranded-DNA-specific exonuclease
MFHPSSSWKIKGQIDQEALPDLKFSPVFRSLMRLRGMQSSDEVLRFITPRLNDLKDPSHMLGMERACHRIAQALSQAEPIGVFSDYDVDGVCSAALIHRFMLKLGCPPPVVFIPDRTMDGYGLNVRGIDELNAQGVRLLITADCGITSVSEVEYAKTLGMDVIVTDHHEPEGTLPEAYCIINPKQPGCPFSGEDLCGAGVVFHLIVALRAHLRNLGYRELPNLREDLDLVAMATVADVVALAGVNRILVREGLSVLNSAGRVGISALAKVSGITRAVLAHDLSYIIGPRINAAGRVSDARKALDLLTTEDANLANQIATELHLLNRQRQAEELKVVKEAVAMIEGDHLPPVIAVAGTNWHMGVIGIVASRLSERFGRPAVVISIVNGIGKGSGRSVEGIDLHTAMVGCAHLLRGFGGHKMAVGFSLDVDKIRSFTSLLETIVARMRTGETQVEVDFQITPNDLTPELIQELDLLAPFGDGNPEPVFMMPAMEVLSTKRFENSKTKLILKQAGRVFHTLGFTLNGSAPHIPRYVDIAFTPVTRRLNGHTYLYLALKALSPG